MKTILIPTDFSDPARAALHYAVRVFGGEAQYILMNAFRDRGSIAAAMVPLMDVLGQASVDSLEEEKEYICKATGLPDSHITTVSLHSDPLSAVCQCVAEYAVDAIVMGATGASGLKESGAGSLVTALVQDAPCPVLAVPASHGHRQERIFVTAGAGWLQKAIAAGDASAIQPAGISMAT